MSEKRKYYVVVREVWERGFAVEAESAEEARQLVNDTSPQGEVSEYSQLQRTLPIHCWDVWEDQGPTARRVIVGSEE